MVDFIDIGGVYKVKTEDEFSPFYEIELGELRRIDDYFRFYPATQIGLTCGIMKRIIKKLSDLNTK